jgi:hypothetical protein
MYTLAGFKPGSSVPEADAMSSAPSSQRAILNFTPCPRGELHP